MFCHSVVSYDSRHVTIGEVGKRLSVMHGVKGSPWCTVACSWKYPIREVGVLDQQLTHVYLTMKKWLWISQ